MVTFVIVMCITFIRNILWNTVVNVLSFSLDLFICNKDITSSPIFFYCLAFDICYTHSNIFIKKKLIIYLYPMKIKCTKTNFAHFCKESKIPFVLKTFTFVFEVFALHWKYWAFVCYVICIFVMHIVCFLTLYSSLAIVRFLKHVLHLQYIETDIKKILILIFFGTRFSSAVNMEAVSIYCQ